MKRTIYLIYILCSAYTVNAQKELNKIETNWVLEAKSQLVSALTNPDMSDSERLRIVQRSAVINPTVSYRYFMKQHIEYLHVQNISSLCLDSTVASPYDPQRYSLVALHFLVMAL